MRSEGCVFGTDQAMAKLTEDLASSPSSQRNAPSIATFHSRDEGNSSVESKLEKRRRDHDQSVVGQGHGTYWRAANFLSVGQIYLFDNPSGGVGIPRSATVPGLLAAWQTRPEGLWLNRAECRCCSPFVSVEAAQRIVQRADAISAAPRLMIADERPLLKKRFCSMIGLR